MKVILAAGGTGGHIYPAIAIADEIRHRHPDWEIVFLGKLDSIEGRIVPEAGYHIENIDVAGYERFYSAARKIKVVGKLLLSFHECAAIFRRQKPDIVIGTGGYVCGPVVMTAALRGIPSLIAEQNVIPGFTIKTLSAFADCVCASFEESIPYMKKPSRCVFSGNPVRREFELVNRENARRSLRLDKNDTAVLIFGGSLGAHTLNVAAAELIKYYNSRDRVKIYLVTGDEGYTQVRDALEADKVKINENIHILSYCNEMPLMLNAADIVVARSGASTIAEINYVGLPAVYVPFPYAANDHQTKNAVVCEKKGAARVIKDAELNGDVLISMVKNLAENPEQLRVMRNNSLKMGRRDSACVVCDNIDKLIEGKK